MTTWIARAARFDPINPAPPVIKISIVIPQVRLPRGDRGSFGTYIFPEFASEPPALASAGFPHLSVMPGLTELGHYRHRILPEIPSLRRRSLRACPRGLRQ